MTQLKAIQEDTQRIAEAISAALGLETEIIDEELTVVAGTGEYIEWVGRKEEYGDPDAGFLYGRVLKTGKAIIVEDCQNDPTYDPSVLEGTVKEFAEIACPIEIQGRVVGIIGIRAIDEDQRQLILERKEALLEFATRMAELLASKAFEDEAMRRLVVTSTQLRTIMESIDEGILAIDNRGVITHCNRIAANLIQMDEDDIVGKRLTDLWPGSPMVDVLKTGKGYDRREESYRALNHPMHFMVSVKPIYMDAEIMGAVASFRDIADIRKLAYDMMALEHSYGIEDILGQSPQIRDLRKQARRIAQSNSTVLITGETGVGKGIVAGAIHFSGPRSAGPFITVNCGAIPDDLLESELFGYEEGAFSGARKGGKPGKFELAHGGTIFLDEIGDLPLRLQVKLLHILQTKKVERLGGTKPISVNVRVIASTNRNIEQMIVDGEFRNDLYFRLNVIPIHISPLRDRKEDILVLFDFFLKNHTRRTGKHIRGISPDAKESFLTYSWPGNVRELENAVEYMINMETSDTITMDSVPARVKRAGLTPIDSDMSLDALVQSYERSLFEQKLEELKTLKGRKERLAEALHISRATMYRKLKKLGIHR